MDSDVSVYGWVVLEAGERMRSRNLNRWHVYEHLKNTYMFSGLVPTQEAIYAKFSGQLDREEIEEGITEFVITVKRFVPSIKREQVFGR